MFHVDSNMFPNIFIFGVVLILALLSKCEGAETVKCACSTCTSVGHCYAEWCLAGFKESRGRFTQECGNSLSALLRNCKEMSGEWKEVCSCNRGNCNSYKFFKTKVKKEGKAGSRSFDSDPMAVGGYDRPDDDDPSSNNLLKSGTNMVILLVCVPLGIGAVAVFFVFINYHCNLC